MSDRLNALTNIVDPIAFVTYIDEPAALPEPVPNGSVTVPELVT
jgi:hypothetical protein